MDSTKASSLGAVSLYARLLGHASFFRRLGANAGVRAKEADRKPVPEQNHTPFARPAFMVKADKGVSNVPKPWYTDNTGAPCS
jgi:hypothetical protein